MRRSTGALPLALAVLLITAPGWPQERKETSASGAMPAHVEAAQTFLLAWGKGNWSEAKAVAADTVTVKVGEKTFALDLAAGKAEAMLVFPFKGISTVRVEGRVKGVTVDEIGIKAGETETRGRGTLTLEEKEGKFLVTGVSVE